MAASPYTVSDLDTVWKIISENTPEPCWRPTPSSLPPTLRKNRRVSLKTVVPDVWRVCPLYILKVNLAIFPRSNATRILCLKTFVLPLFHRPYLCPCITRFYNWHCLQPAKVNTGYAMSNTNPCMVLEILWFTTWQIFQMIIHSCSNYILGPLDRFLFRLLDSLINSLLKFQTSKNCRQQFS